MNRNDVNYDIYGQSVNIGHNVSTLSPKTDEVANVLTNNRSQRPTTSKDIKSDYYQAKEYRSDYSDMQFDLKHNEEPIMDVSSMPIGLGSKFLYNKISTSQQQSMDNAACVNDGAEMPSKYATLREYENYPNEYPMSSIYISKAPVGRGLQCTYQPDHTTLINSQAQITASSQDLNVTGLPDLSTGPTVRYIRAQQYDEMSEYELTAGSTCPIESNYAENTAAAYGYVSDANYGITNVNVNNISYSPRPLLFNDNPNSEASMGLDPNSRSFETQLEFQKKLSQLTINPIEIVSQTESQYRRDVVKGDMLEGSENDIGSTMRWRDPNLSEVISFLNNPNNSIKANAAAYLQHLCYMDDPNKQRTRTLGGIPPLVRLLSYEIPEIHKNACGALRNLSYGRQNDENKRAIKNAGGIPALINLLCKTQESEVKELVTGVLWNMSSCEDIKRTIIDDGLVVFVNNIIKPHSGWDPVCPGETCYSTVFRNASGVIRNVSSAGKYARTMLRDTEPLVECLLYVLKTAIQKNNIGNKTVENCVCILRNLSYRCQEVEDPNYDKQPTIMSSRDAQPSTSKGDNLGCFGTSKKKKEAAQSEQQLENIYSSSASKNQPGGILPKRYEQLWQPEVVQYYLALLQSCSNPETLEAAAGAIQNLAACFWQPSVDIRATVRKEKGLPILVELLRMEVDRVVCAVATALRNLAIDQRNKELIGKYAMQDLVQKLPSGNPQHDHNTSDDTICAVLATINEVIKRNPEFSRSLLDAGGVERLLNITKQRQKYTACVLKFASQVLFTMWQHHELRDVYKKNGWKEQDFVTKSFATHNFSPNSPNNVNNTLNRPMASQGRTKYEDKTIQRVPNNSRSNGGVAISNDFSVLRRMTDEVSSNGLRDEAYQIDAQNPSMAMYIPIVDCGRNHSN
ncbi:catenin delta-2 isoform X2 [Teleopsis dalmanni]|uniref:catenin delta-2 isoform X2 n=1 Tax=Teleopsis dalmanni TaxID=139649 RepID=UPI0018CE0A97|nr:catenin delta-2 isoform X2 [Teleopsis dalmanni]